MPPWANLPELNWLCGYMALSVELFKTGLLSAVVLTSWKDAGVFNAGLWRIGNDCEIFRVLRPPYKW